MTYRLSPLAEADLEEIWLYTFREWSLEQQADAYHRKIIKAVEGLAAGRNVWQKTNIRADYWKYQVGKHVIFSATRKDLWMLSVFCTKDMDTKQHLD